MNDLMNIKGVRGRLNENGVAELNLEDVARGLGFTQKAKSGNEVVRWERVNKYLEEFDISAEKFFLQKDGECIPTCGDDGFIPENIFYKLCFKARNETARQFQDLVTDEILPTIRKTGAYMTPEKIEEILISPDTVINLAKQIKSLQVVNHEQTKQIEVMQPKALFADAVTTSKTSILVGEMAKILKQNGVDTGEKRFYQWLRDNGYLIKRKGSDYNTPTQKSMELGIFEVKKTTITHSDGLPEVKTTSKVTGKGQVYFANKFCNRCDMKQ